MSTLLLELIANPSLNRTLFPAHILIFDDIMIYKKRSWFIVKEVTISYNQISQVTLTNGIIFSNLDIITTGDEDIRIKWITKLKAREAKTIIDQKIYHSHAKHNPATEADKGRLYSVEKSLNRLKELRVKGQINEKEYEYKKNEFIKGMK